MSYVSHARTPEQLLAELLGDIAHRISRTKMQLEHAPSVSDKVKTVRVLTELEDMQKYWNELTIVRPVRKREPPK